MIFRLITILLTLAGLSLIADDDRALVYFPDGTKYICEIADTPQKRAIGLAEHSELPAGTGMLFIFQQPSYTGFWMPPKMKFSLDMIFLDRDLKVVHIAENCKPCKDPSGWDCDSFSPDIKVSWVLEVNAGQVKRHSLKPGDILRVELPGPQK